MINDFKHDEPLVILLYITFKYLSKYTLIFFSSVHTLLALTPLPPCTHLYAFSLTPSPLLSVL